MRKTTRKQFGAAMAALFILALFALSTAAAQVAFKGEVIHLDEENLSLEKKFDRAHSEFKKGKKGDAYFTGYIYLSRHDIQFGDEGSSNEPYRVYVDEGNIKVRRTWNQGINSRTETNRDSAPVGVIFLHDGQSGNIVDISHIDLEKTYTVEDFPLYWFGQTDNDESFRFFTARFGKAEAGIQDEYIFFIGSHVHPQAPNFLKQVALGNYPSKARENAIFWLGSNKYDKSIDYLKEIYSKEESSDLREKVVFSLYILGDVEAVKELIRIAKNDGSSQVRKQAIFWLGQKASEESIQALKGVISDSREETSVKEAAVFAISQLPKDRSVPMLIQIARSNQNSKVRQNAIFWLGQKDSEQALKFFEEILLKKK